MNQSYQRQAIGSWSMALLLWIGYFVGSIGSAAAVTPQIAAGGFHNIVLESDGALVAWGE